MNHCRRKDCKLIPWLRRLCYTHWRESQGFVFDGKMFVKAKKIA
jgi:hypothetical protein